MEFERRERFARHIDLTALVDIVFHLMVFFMLTTSFVVSESMELSLPSSSQTATASTLPQLTRIVVGQGGSITVGGAPVSADDLQSMLITTLGNNPEARIIILSTPGVLVQELVAVLDMVYFAGGRNVQVDKGVL